MEPIERTRQWAMQIYKGEAEKAELFLARPHPMLENRRPTEVDVDDRGAERVISLLGRAAFGGGVDLFRPTGFSPALSGRGRLGPITDAQG